MINLLKKHPFFTDKNIESCTLLENQGYCNENYLLVADGIKYIVRKLLRDDIDRDFEWKVQNLAYAQGITAEPLVFDENDGFMVFEFLEGIHKKKLDEHNLKNLALTLQKLHHIKIDAEPRELDIANKTNEVQKSFKTSEYKYKETRHVRLSFWFISDLFFVARPESKYNQKELISIRIFDHVRQT